MYRFIDICHVNRVYFPSTSEAGLVNTVAVHGNKDTVDLGGKVGLEPGGVASS